MAQTFHALENPSYRLLWPAGFLSYTSRWMQLTLLSWLVLELTGSPWQVALLGFFFTVPMAVVGLAGGVLTDAFSRERTIQASQAAGLLSASVMTVLLLTGLEQTWHAHATILVAGSVFAVDLTVRRALTHDLLGPSGITNGLALDFLSMAASRIIGPALAGVMIAQTGVGDGYLVLSGFHVASLAMLLAMRGAPTTVPTRKRRAGLDYVRGEQTLLAVIAVTVLLNVLLFPYRQMFPSITRDVLEVGPTLMGVLLAAEGVGALVGAVLIARAEVIRVHGRLYLGGSAMAMLALLLFAYSPWYGLALPALFLMGVGAAGFGAMQGTIVILASREDMRGRALGVTTLAIGAGPLGALLYGAVGSLVSPTFAVGSLAAIGVGGMALIWFLMPSLRRTTDLAGNAR